MTATRFESEINEQPACLAHLLTAGRAEVESIATAIRRFDPAFVVTAARGSSDNAARYAKYLFGAHNQLVVSLGAPSLITLYRQPPALQRALLLGISQSGQSPDIVALLLEGRRQGALTIAITNDPGSPLAQAADHVIDLRAGREQAIAASKSYTCQLLALAMLSAALEDAAGRWNDLSSVPNAVSQTLAALSGGTVFDAISPFANSDRLVVIGRGFNFATAFEIALKLKEIAQVMADPYATPDLFHGPLALIESGIPAIVIAPTGPTLDGARDAIDTLTALGARVLVLSNDPDMLGPDRNNVAISFASRLPEWLTPISAAIPGQLCALRLAQERGLDPDRPRGLQKVTRTH